jgi:hypothetical protein
VSLSSARDDYGVVLRDSDHEVDQAATLALRAGHRIPTKLFHNGTYVDAMN